MANLTKTRSWEVEALAKECDVILANTKEADMHPYKLNQINEKLKVFYLPNSFQQVQFSASSWFLRLPNLRPH